jgi:serine phosphatase RsbU (regulator of sigma subunit)
VSEVGRHGTLLGAFSAVDWPEAPLQMRPGETLVAFTDGVTDTVGEGEERFGLSRLKEILADAQNESPTVIRERLVAGLEEFQVGAQADDTAIVIMRFTGATATSGSEGKISSASGTRVA